MYYLRKKLFGPLASRETGKLRRDWLPPGAPRPGADSVSVFSVDDEQLEVTSDYYELKEATIDGEPGKKLFYTTVLPKNRQVESVIVFFHGYSDHHDFLLMNLIRAYAHHFNAAVLGVDMPGHGRSDGTWVYVPDWHEFTEAGAEFVKNVAKPMCAELRHDQDAEQLKLFIQGVSMGGGICATLALSHPELMDGMILEAPMLSVSDDIKPPWLVQQLFKHVLVRLFPRWPAAPSKDILDRCWSNPKILEVVHDNRATQGLGFTAKPRLKTAYSLAFQCPEYLTPRLKDITTPFFVVHGAADEVTDPNSSQQLYDVASVPAQDKTIRIVPGAKHGDCFYRAEMYDEVGVWIGQRIGSKSKYATKNLAAHN